MAFHARLAEQPQLRIGLRQRDIDATEHRHAMPVRQDCARSRRAVLADRRHRQAQDGAGVQRELAQVLRSQRHQAGVVRAWRHFAEPHLVALHEQLHAEHAPAAEIVGDAAGDALRTRQRAR